MDAHCFLLLALVEGFGERPLEALLAPDADPSRLLAEPGRIPAAARARLRDPQLPARAEAVRAAAAAAGQVLLTPADARYPDALRWSPTRPLVLFARGDVAILQRQPAVAVVGSRTPTPYGVDAATAFTAALAGAGVVVWSGLARGVDATAHRQCLRVGAPTVAVLAGGLDRLYPPEHAELAEAIARGGGCLVAELPPGRRARRGHFPRRNRVLAAGTVATLVVEAGSTSGALSTAWQAAAGGRTVFAVPGPWGSARSRGCHRLLQEGAAVAPDPAELLRDLGVTPQTAAVAARGLLRSADEQAILDRLGAGPRPADLVRRESGLPRDQFAVARFLLEQRGALRTLPGDLLAAQRGDHGDAGSGSHGASASGNSDDGNSDDGAGGVSR